MPTITLIGSAFIVLGMIFIAFTPRERIVQVTSASWGTSIAVSNADGTLAAGTTVPFYEPDKVLAWDNERKIYRWVPLKD